ncbi:MAG: asparagine synthase (glutamine-hydrolyzing) [Planctomycetes bacterium]|nr:asparagine synthase (glutamine-hydrolyzing) [Planctomycetota bacterium]
MCGIAGFWQYGARTATVRDLVRMGERQAHRGPDDRGHLYVSDGGPRFFVREDEAPPGVFPEVGLAHRRLTILDLSERGRQPMADSSGRAWIVYNGEVYNFREIRRNLEARGRVFSTATDTEVVLAAYLEWGEECLARLDGMFAFAIWDSRERRLFLARDRLGVKPLCYAHAEGRAFAFASEAKALLALDWVDGGLDPRGIDSFLTFLWIPDPGSGWLGVKRLPPGHLLVLDAGGRVETRRWWNPLPRPRRTPSDPQAAEEVREALERSVKDELVSDVPLGSFLSGGVDSTAILAFMKRAGVERPATYSIGFAPEDLAFDIVPDDLPYARRVAAHFGSDHREIVLSPDVADLLPKLVWHMDDPVADPAAISSYLVCRAAKERSTVLLSGMGGDEVYAGYPRHLANRLAEGFLRIPRAIRAGLIRPAARLLPPAGRGALARAGRNARKFLRSAEAPFEERYLGFGTYFDRAERYALYEPSFAREVGEHDPYALHRSFLAESAGLDPVDRMVHLDLMTFLPFLNLHYTDRTSMAASVEVRVPFLGHEVVEHALSLPPDQKLRRTARKFVLKKALEGVVPEFVLRRPKAGFGAPIRSWLVGPLRGVVEDLASEASVRRRGLFRPQAVRRVVDDLYAHRADNALKVWQFLTLELWLRAFSDRRGEPT